MSSTTSVVPATSELPKGYEGNDPLIEQAFAVKAIEHAEVYYTLCQKVKASSVRLTKHDADILKSFKETFPHLATKAKLQKLDEDKDLKSVESRPKWAEWMKSFASTVDDYNMGTLLRADCTIDYTQENSIFVTRIQFLAVEVARNELALNDWIYEEAQKEAAAAKKGKKKDPKA